jgi:hypothetical protein
MRAIGRIRLADERAGHEMWEWAINPPLPIPSWGAGRAPSFEDAKTAFRAAWAIKGYRQPTSSTGIGTKMMCANVLSGWLVVRQGKARPRPSLVLEDQPQPIQVIYCSANTASDLSCSRFDLSGRCRDGDGARLQPV